MVCRISWQMIYVSTRQSRVLKMKRCNLYSHFIREHPTITFYSIEYVKDLEDARPYRKFIYSIWLL